MRKILNTDFCIFVYFVVENTAIPILLILSQNSRGAVHARFISHIAICEGENSYYQSVFLGYGIWYNIGK